MVNNWIVWNGGACPVPKGKLVDVKYRSGHTKCSMPALEDAGDESGIDANSCFWFHDSHQYDIIAYRLHQPEQQAWNGEGLPPVGIECELFDCEQWNPVKVKYVGDKYVVTDRLDLGYEIVYCVAERPEKFRPIRTEAERKRDEFTDACIDIDSSQDWSHSTDYFRGLYNAIAAGKIPGVKLED